MNPVDYGFQNVSNQWSVNKPQISQNVDEERNSSIIKWTGNAPYEFKILDPEIIAKKWGIRKNKPTMTYEKLSRGLRYYYDRHILQKTHRKKYVYQFTCDIKPYLKKACSFVPNAEYIHW